MTRQDKINKIKKFADKNPEFKLNKNDFIHDAFLDRAGNLHGIVFGAELPSKSSIDGILGKDGKENKCFDGSYLWNDAEIDEIIRQIDNFNPDALNIVEKTVYIVARGTAPLCDCSSREDAENYIKDVELADKIAAIKKKTKNKFSEKTIAAILAAAEGN